MSEKYMVTAEEVAAVLANPRHKSAVDDRPEVVSTYDIAKEILGKDPAAGKDSARYGGKTPEGWMNEHLSMPHLKRVLAAMEEVGVITKFVATTYYSGPEDKARERLVRFSYRTKSGWVLTEDLKQSVATQDAKRRNAERTVLKVMAEKRVLEDHAEEVQDLYTQLCEQKNLDPTHEKI